MRIVAALGAATVIPLWFFGAVLQDSGAADTLGNISQISFLVGLALAWIGFFPLFISLWRASERTRTRMLRLIFSLPLFLIAPMFGVPLLSFLMPTLLFPLIGLLFIIHPLISALLLASVRRETHALHQTKTSHRWFSFVMVGGMVVMLLGGLLFNLDNMLNHMLTSQPFPPIFFLLGIGAAIIVACLTLFKLRKSKQASPKDISLSHIDSPQEPRGYRG